MEFELREEHTIRYSNGVVKVEEAVIAHRPKNQIKEVFHDMEVGHRRNLNKNEDFSGDRILSIVRVK
jgi:hypothetical protein